MKQFFLGFITAIAIVLIAIVGLYRYFTAHFTDTIFNYDWPENKAPELQITIYPSEEIDLTDALGNDAESLAKFLAHGDEDAMQQYLQIFETGMSVSIRSEFDANGTDHSQTIHFSNGISENRIYTEVSSVTLIRDSPPNLLDGVLEELRSKADTNQDLVEALESSQSENAK